MTRAQANILRWALMPEGMKLTMSIKDGNIVPVESKEVKESLKRFELSSLVDAVFVAEKLVADGLCSKKTADTKDGQEWTYTIDTDGAIALTCVLRGRVEGLHELIAELRGWGRKRHVDVDDIPPAKET